MARAPWPVRREVQKFVNSDGTPKPDSPQTDEQRPGPVFAYRGQNTHGVDPGQPWETPRGPAFDNKVPVVYDPPEKETPPVDVRIVKGETHNERDDWRVIIAQATGNPAMIVNRQDGRKTVKLLNESTVVVRIAQDMNVSVSYGYPIAAGASFDVSTSEEIWAVSADGSQARITAIALFTQELPR